MSSKGILMLKWAFPGGKPQEKPLRVIRDGPVRVTLEENPKP